MTENRVFLKWDRDFIIAVLAGETLSWRKEGCEVNFKKYAIVMTDKELELFPV